MQVPFDRTAHVDLSRNRLARPADLGRRHREPRALAAEPQRRAVAPGLTTGLTTGPLSANPVALRLGEPQAAGNRRATRHGQPQRLIIVDAQDVASGPTMPRNDHAVGSAADRDRLVSSCGRRQWEDALEQTPLHFVMIHEMVRVCATILALALVAPISAGPLTVTDIDGHEWTPLAPAKGEVNLLLFVSSDCPVAAHYAPEIARIASTYGPRGVHTWLIYADLTATIPSVRANLKAFYPGAKIPTVIDVGFEITAAVNATVTPEAAVYSPAGLMYRGRIDDLYVSFGKSRPAAQHHDLRDALDAILAGRPVPVKETSPVGCYIEKLKGQLW